MPDQNINKEVKDGELYPKQSNNLVKLPPKRKSGGIQKSSPSRGFKRK